MASIIGLAGKKRVGKSTVAAALAHFGWDKRSFADPLRGACRYAFEVSDGYLGESKDELQRIVVGDTARRHAHRLLTCLGLPGTRSHEVVAMMAAKYEFTSGRDMLQWVGTELIRNLFGDDFWVRDELHPPSDKPVVYDDCRFGSEREFIRGRGGALFFIHRFGLPPDADLHASEQSLGLPSEYDMTIVNDCATADEFGRIAAKTIDQHLKIERKSCL